MGVKFYIKIYLSYVAQQVQMHTQAATYQTPDLSPPLLTTSGAKFHPVLWKCGEFLCISFQKGALLLAPSTKAYVMLYRWPKVSTNSFWF